MSVWVDDLMSDGWVVVDTQSEVVGGEWRFFASQSDNKMYKIYVAEIETTCTLEMNGLKTKVRVSNEVAQNATSLP